MSPQYHAEIDRLVPIFRKLIAEQVPALADAALDALVSQGLEIEPGHSWVTLRRPCDIKPGEISGVKGWTSLESAEAHRYAGGSIERRDHYPPISTDPAASAMACGVALEKLGGLCRIRVDIRKDGAAAFLLFWRLINRDPDAASNMTRATAATPERATAEALALALIAAGRIGGGDG